MRYLGTKALISGCCCNVRETACDKVNTGPDPGITSAEEKSTRERLSKPVQNRLAIGFLGALIRKNSFMPYPYLVGEKSFNKVVETIDGRDRE